jgi:hypothetical protein
MEQIPLISQKSKEFDDLIFLIPFNLVQFCYYFIFENHKIMLFNLYLPEKNKRSPTKNLFK